MIRGTSTQFTFKLPFPKRELQWATIKFWQPHNTSTLLPITKKLEDCDAPDDFEGLCISLNGEETARFLDKFRANVQLRAQHINGTIFGVRPQFITVYPMNDNIIEEDPTMPPNNATGLIIFDGDEIMGQ